MMTQAIDCSWRLGAELGCSAQAPRGWSERRLSWRGIAAGLGIMASLLSGARAGAQQAKDSLAPASVHVPTLCADAKAPRCPLVVFAQAPVDIVGSSAARAMIEWQRALADRYGAILLVHDSAGLPSTSRDTLLDRTLRTYAVDPTKIAVIGYVDHLWGCPDSPVFSRVAILSPAPGLEAVCLVKRLQPRAQVYLAGGLGELGFVAETMRSAAELRRSGYALELGLALRGSTAGPEDFEQVWHWLSQSWEVPAVPVASASPAAGAGTGRSPADDDGSGPLLSAQALGQLTTFWSRFLREPDSIRLTARLAHQQQITVPVGTERFTLRMMDTPALAAQYPSVRASLRAVGLTAQQADAYRRALIIAAANNMATQWITLHWPTQWRGSGSDLTVAAHSPLGRNIAFLQAPKHKEALKALGATGMWITP